MRRALCLIAAALLALPAFGAFTIAQQSKVAPVQTFQPINYDAFAYSNGALPSPWATITSETLIWVVSSNTATTNATSGADNGVRYTTNQPTANQYSSILLAGTISNVSPGDGYCASTRMSTTAVTYYRGCCSAAGSAIASLVAGSGTNLNSQTVNVCATGDTLVMTAIGTAIKLYRVRAGTWLQLDSATDSSIASGYCGMAYSSTASGAVSQFQCGNLN